MDIYLEGGMCPREIKARLKAAVTTGIPARSTVSRSHVATPVRGVSRKTRLPYATDSMLEAETAIFADVLEDVVAYAMQPVCLHYRDGGRLTRAYPDVGLLMIDGTVELWEVKPERASEALVRRLGTLSRLLHARGVRYRVRTPLWLHRAPRRANVRAVWASDGVAVGETLRDDLAQRLGAGEATTLGALRAQLGVEAPVLHAAVLRGLVAVDLDAGPLSDASPVRPPKPGALSGGYLGAEHREVRA